MLVLQSFVGELDRLRRILIRSCSVEMFKIANVLGIVFEQRFIIKGKSSIEITNREVEYE